MATDDRNVNASSDGGLTVSLPRAASSDPIDCLSIVSSAFETDQVSGQSYAPHTALGTSFSGFDAASIMILPAHELGFPATIPAQAPNSSPSTLTAHTELPQLSNLSGQDAWLSASASSTPSSIASFTFSPVSYHDANASLLIDSAAHLCTPSTSYEDGPIAGTSAGDKGKARARSLSPPSIPSSGLFDHMPADTVLSISPQPREPLSKTIGTVEEIITSTSLPAARSRRPSSPIGGRRRLTKSRFNTQSKLSRRNTLAIERVLDVDSRSLTSVSYETASAPRPQHATLPLRRDLRMGRAYTSPDSFAWQLSDRVDDDDDDISNTVVLSPRSAFDARLPREVKLHVFAVVIQLHEIEYRKRMVSSGWTAVQSASERYVGRSRGFVDLIRLSRVSKSWRSLAFDGQLWSQLDLQMLAQMPVPAVTRIFAAAGPFIRDMNFQGYQSLSVQLLKRFASAIVIAQPGRKCLPTSQLTSLNLAGCNLVATKMLHELILASPNLRWVSFKGLACVTNVTCVILGRTCSQLCSLNLSRCKNMDATGVVSVASVPLGSKVPYTSLEELRLCGLKGASAALVVALARGSPFLKTLDLSYSTGLTDGDLDVFTAWRSEWNDLTDSSSPFDKISLSAREMGYDPSDPTRYFKRLTRLRHLNISNCKLLTDAACSHLAYAVPRLESLEIAGLGQGLEDDGLARLLRTTPLLKRLDLEDSIEISNAILEVLTPEQDPHRSRRARPLVVDPRPGDHLEHLILSCCSRITSDALVSLIKACPRLRVLEIDGTRAGASVVREFVRYSKRRNLVGAEVNVSDCRGLPGDSLVRELNPHTRHRRGWRGWDARRLRFLDSEGDCDESRVLFKSFWTWQAADAARAARDRRLKSAVATGTATTLEGMEMQQLLESEELSFRDPTDARQARFRWVKALGQLSPSSESCTIM